MIETASGQKFLVAALRGHLGTCHPESISGDSVIGQRACEALEVALQKVAATPAAVDLLLSVGMRPSFLGPSADTALMVAVMGSRRGWTDERIVEACISGLFADVGMLRLPDDVAINKPGALSPEEQRMMRLHPALGAEVLEPLAATLGAQLAEIAHQHHERIDGGGYPRGLEGTAILEEAQAVGICHLYLAATRVRSYREALSPAKTLALIEGLAGTAWDPRVVRAFVDGIAPYPIGTLVRLSSGECGTVVRGGEALRPLVEVQWAQDGTTVPPRLVPASTGSSGLRIVAIGS